MARRNSTAPAVAFRDRVIHQLSQPVTALQGSLEVALLRRQSGIEYKKALEAALEQANRLAKILEDLRDNAVTPK
jgi:signal transduction histidine kinase